MASTANGEFRPAIIVVDMQEDFCPPKGALAVQGGRDIAPLINKLLSRSGFVVKIATQDFHPKSHISFAANHPGPNNKPFESVIELSNPAPGKTHETKRQRLWPVHCVQNSPGAEIIPEIDTNKIDLFVLKGMDERVEMYSAFADAFGNKRCAETGAVNVDLEEELRSRRVTDVFVVGIAGDYCVKYTALDAVVCGFKVWVIEEGVKCVDERAGWDCAKDEMAAAGVRIIHADAPELAAVVE
ncbi:hypothetical protein VTO42DRAFT_2021 [Malbranchea cinnamomea]